MINMVTFFYCISNYRFTTIWSNMFTYINIYTLMMKQFKSKTNLYSQQLSLHAANKQCNRLNGMMLLRQAFL